MKIDTIKRQLVRFEVLAVVLLKIQVVRDITTCGLVNSCCSPVDKDPRNINSPRRGLFCGTCKGICLELYCEIQQNCCKRTQDEWVAPLKADICESRKTKRVPEERYYTNWERIMLNIQTYQ